MPENAVSVIVFVLTGFCFPQNTTKPHYPVLQVVISNLHCCNLQVSYKPEVVQNVCSILRSRKQYQTSSCLCQHAVSAAGEQQ